MNETDKYIEKLNNPQKEIFQSLRKIILTKFPGIKEGMKWGVPAFGEDAFYIVALRNHVNLGFNYGAELPDPYNLLEGTGKLFRHIKIKSVEQLSNKELITLLRYSTTYRVPHADADLS